MVFVQLFLSQSRLRDSASQELFCCQLTRPPHTNRFFVGRQKIFTCWLVCGEFRQVCDKIGACRTKSDSARSQNVLSGLVGKCAMDHDNLSALARTSTNKEMSRDSREWNRRILILNDPALNASLNAFSRD